MAERDSILAKDDTRAEMVPTPEWAPEVPEVEVRGLKARARDTYTRSLITVEGEKVKYTGENGSAKLVVLTAYHEGALLFAPTDADALGEKNAAVVNRLADVASRLSGLRDDLEKLKGN